MIFQKKKLLASASEIGGSAFVSEFTLPEMYAPTITNGQPYPISNAMAVANDGAVSIISSVQTVRGFISSDRRATMVNFAPNGRALQWGYSFRKSGSSYDEVYQSNTCVDGNGNIYSAFTNYPGGIFITKHSPTGALLLRRDIVASGVTYVDNLVVDPNGAVYIIGRQVSWAGLFVKLDSSLNIVWKTNWGYDNYDLRLSVDRGSFSPDGTKFVVAANFITSPYIFIVHLNNGAITTISVPGGGYVQKCVMDKAGFVYVIKTEPSEGVYKGYTVYRINPSTTDNASDLAWNFQYILPNDIALDNEDNLIVMHQTLGAGAVNGKIIFTKISAAKGVVESFAMTRALCRVDKMYIDKFGAIYICGYQTDGYKGFVAKIDRFGAPYQKFGAYITSPEQTALASLIPTGKKSIAGPSIGQQLAAIGISDRGAYAHQIFIYSMNANFQQIPLEST